MNDPEIQDEGMDIAATYILRTFDINFLINYDSIKV